MLLGETGPAPGFVSPTRIWNILVVCTGNSARSIMAEAIFNQFSGGWFHAYSAGSQPAGRVNPHALSEIAACGLYVAHYRSKNIREFTGNGVPQIDLVLTVCGNAQAEACSILGSDLNHVHWELPDPAAVTGEEAARVAFANCFALIKSRVEFLRGLRLADYDKQKLAGAMRKMAKPTPAIASTSSDLI